MDFPHIINNNSPPFFFADVRNNMTQFWQAHSSHASLEEMTLDSHAETLSQLEIPEILDMLPDYTGKDVLELGAGIG